MADPSDQPDGLEGRPCRRCGMMIYFAPSFETGKQVPLQMIKTVWYVSNGSAHRADIEHMAEARTGTGCQHYVSHFETCPEAGTFSKGRKRG